MAQFQTYNFKTIVSGSAYNGTNFTVCTNKELTEFVDLTNCVIKCSLRKTFLLPILWTFTTENDSDGQILITDAVHGEFSIIGCNMDLDSGNYVHDIRIFFPNGEEKVYIRGTWNLLAKSTS